jgi:hypothetical protein
LHDKLDIISTALLLNLVKGLGFKDQVLTLDKIGLKEIAIVKLLDATRDRVHGVLRKKGQS